MPDDHQEAIKTVLYHSQTPKSMLQIRKDLPDKLRMSSKEMSALLDQMTAAGKIFRWPQKRFWDRDPAKAASRGILEFLEGSPAVTVARIRTAMKQPPKIIQSALEELIGTGRAHVWQPGKTPHFCLFKPRDAAVDMIVRALADGPLTEKELITWVRKKLPGYQAKHLREHISQSDGIFEHPKHGKVKTRYGLRPAEPGPYLIKAVQEVLSVHKLLAPFHVSFEAIHDALWHELGLKHGERALIQERPQAGRPSREAQPLILEGITRLQPHGQRRALVSIRELRRSVGLAKSVFDEAVLSLALQGKVALHHHDFPASLSPDERDELVRDEQGTYYVGIVPKEMS
jgi:hypothetical protein